MLTLDQIVSMNDKSAQMLPWNKLNKSLKLKRMMDFADELSVKEELDEAKTDQLKMLLRTRLDRKCLQRVKDVVYNAEEGKILSIPSLIRVQSKFTLRSESQSPLSSLAPKNKTVRASQAIRS
jgi:hypothetical protein